MLHHALTTNDRHPFGIDRSCRENNLLAGNAGPEKYADMDPVGKSDASADRFDTIDNDSFLVLFDYTQTRRALLCVGAGSVHLRIDKLRRAVKIVVLRKVDKVNDIFPFDVAFRTNGLSF